MVFEKAFLKRLLKRFAKLLTLMPMCKHLVLIGKTEWEKSKDAMGLRTLTSKGLKEYVPNCIKFCVKELHAQETKLQPFQHQTFYLSSSSKQ